MQQKQSTWTKKEEELGVVEKKAMRIIMGPINFNENEWEEQTSKLRENMGRWSEQVLNWLGQVLRIGANTTIYAVFGVGTRK